MLYFTIAIMGRNWESIQNEKRLSEEHLRVFQWSIKRYLSTQKQQQNQWVLNEMNDELHEGTNG